jgi:hypothetical protein
MRSPSIVPSFLVDKLHIIFYFVNQKIVGKEVMMMAKNPPPGDGHRHGAVRDRSQVYNDKIDRWIKRDTETGQFMDQKSDGEPFKGIRKE